MSKEIINHKLKNTTEKHKSRVDSNDIIISHKIHDFRIKRSMTLSEVSKQMGVSITQLQKYELGINRVSAGRLCKMAKIFKIHVAQFFDFIDCDYEINGISGTRKEIKMLKYFDQLSDKEQRAFVEVMKAIVEAREKKEKEEKDESGRTE